MTFRDWQRDTVHRVKDDGIAGAKESLYELYLGALRRGLAPVYDRGESIYERDWDLLIVLDACRADMMADVAHEYSFINHGSVYSNASHSSQWMERNFSSEYSEQMKETAYITGNPFSAQHLIDEQFLVLDEVWRYGWSDNLGTIEPDPLTDRAISVGRERNPDRMIVHYMQPHHPFIGDEVTEGFEKSEFPVPKREDVWQRARKGEEDLSDVIDAYYNNLRHVLDRLDTLLNNVSAERVAITADHGNAIGEIGVYGHPDVPMPALRDVPWCVTEATDTGSYDPELSPSVSANDQVEERLESLGYR